MTDAVKRTQRKWMHCELFDYVAIVRLGNECFVRR